MKFLCDRCKTRYSIGDERVRGKILKIRCKNCNNVITVREGMPELAAEVPVPGRARNVTQAVPLVDDPTNGALGAAFASAMTQPPPALEEEWYVSIDGDQAGPFSLAEAQRWVASKPVDADLHCWCEGFDDWLPIDKVSHFRGLRKRPAPPPMPAVPPPLPRAATGAVRRVTQSVPVVAARAEDEPKPLFAATMASLEKGLQEPIRSLGIPSIRGSTLPSATPSLGNTAMPARGNGAATPAAVPGRSGQIAAIPAAFDVPASAPERAAPPIADPAPNDAYIQSLGQALGARASGPTAAAAPAKSGLADDDDLDIGEVSRVVNLADLARTAQPRAQRPSSATMQARTGSVGRISASSIAIAGPADPRAPAEAAPLIGPSVAYSHRKHMIALMVGALLLLGVTGGVVLYVMSSDDGPSGGLGRVGEIDTTRPDDPIRRAGSAGAAVQPQNPFVPKRPTTYRPQPTQPVLPENPDAKALGADEIEQMAAKYSGTTQRCYIRSQRGADAILIGDVKKIGVTLTVDKGGTVTNVALSEHANNTLGKCLISSIKGWKFRESSAGITAKITMVFQSG